ncbi:hypothetical protein Leryth_001366 [Lithospermum erythrorhizon]|nr:hypothetical protein Leryth_001366 [Lithospermum erythrorhizon]
MSGKASVSKDLNAKHAKILEGLLKQPENKECADCRNKAPRWASINLGIFICMQCSGIHRSLGVHISKVRSTTLDTWLPEQVLFLQSTGNEVANNYWEAELHPNYNRGDIEKFIRDKYQERKWISRTASQPIPTPAGTLGSLAKCGIPKKARKYSLEEGLFREPTSVLPASNLRPRAGSLDMEDPSIVTPTQDSKLGESEPPETNVDAMTDLFSLLYVSEASQDRTVVPPSRWATFDCKCIILRLLVVLETI